MVNNGTTAVPSFNPNPFRSWRFHSTHRAHRAHKPGCWLFTLLCCRGSVAAKETIDPGKRPLRFSAACRRVPVPLARASPASFSALINP